MREAETSAAQILDAGIEVIPEPEVLEPALKPEVHNDHKGHVSLGTNAQGATIDLGAVRRRGRRI